MCSVAVELISNSRGFKKFNSNINAQARRKQGPTPYSPDYSVCPMGKKKIGCCCVGFRHPHFSEGGVQ